MQYKLICIDMDGTLLNKEGKLSEQNKKAIQEATKQGVNVAITTGRMYKYVKTFRKLEEIEGPMITSNGASVALDSQTEPFYSETMPYEQLVRFYECAKKYNLRIHFTTPDGILFNEPLPKTHLYYQINQELPEGDRMELQVVEDYEHAFRAYEGKIIKALCIDEETREHLEALREELEEVGGYEIVSSWINNIEVMPLGISKGKGVKMLAEKLQIPLEQVMCIGDSENDLSMLEIAGLAVAMGNATQQIKEVADYITKANDEDGVAIAIEKFILGIDNNENMV